MTPGRDTGANILLLRRAGDVLGIRALSVVAGMRASLAAPLVPSPSVAVNELRDVTRNGDPAGFSIDTDRDARPADVVAAPVPGPAGIGLVGVFVYGTVRQQARDRTGVSWHRHPSLTASLMT